MKKSFYLIIFIVVSFIAFADNDEEIKQKEKELKQFQEAIKEKENKVNLLKKEELSTQKKLTQFKKKIDITENKTIYCTKKLQLTHKEIEQLKIMIENKNQQIESKNLLIFNSLRNLYKYKQKISYPLYFYIPSFEVSAYKRIKLINLAIKMQKNEKEQLIEKRDIICEDQNKKNKVASVLKKEKTYLEKEKSSLISNVVKEKQFLIETKSKKEAYITKIKELKSAQRDLESLLFDLKKRTQNSNPSDFYKKRKNLIWPVIPIKVYSEENKLHIYKGIIIEAQENEVVKNVFDGTVIFSGQFKGYEKLVIIDHGSGYYTLYARLSEIFVAKGTKINEGAVIGRIGNNNSSFGSRLYFEIRSDGIAQNPLGWLK